MSATKPPSKVDLIQSLETEIHKLKISASYASGKSDDLYEGYLFGRVLRAAAFEKFTIELRDTRGARAKELHLRRSPGRIYSGLYTHALLEHPSCKPLEVHVGVRARGRSNVLHEADVMVIHSAAARTCTKKFTDPRGTDILVHLEAKYFTQPAGLAVGRELIGFSSDFNCRSSVLACTLMTPATKRLLTGYPHAGVQPRENVRPMHPGETRLHEFLTSALRSHRDGTAFP